MEKKVYKYESPVIEVVETSMNGVLCDSGCNSDCGHGYGGNQNACNVGGFPGLPGTNE